MLVKSQVHRYKSSFRSISNIVITHRYMQKSQVYMLVKLEVHRYKSSFMKNIYTSQVYIHDLFHRYKLIVNGSQEV